MSFWSVFDAVFDRWKRWGKVASLVFSLGIAIYACVAARAWWGRLLCALMLAMGWVGMYHVGKALTKLRGECDALIEELRNLAAIMRELRERDRAHRA